MFHHHHVWLDVLVGGAVAFGVTMIINSQNRPQSVPLTQRFEVNTPRLQPTSPTLNLPSSPQPVRLVPTSPTLPIFTK